MPYEESQARSAAPGTVRRRSSRRPWSCSVKRGSSRLRSMRSPPMPAWEAPRSTATMTPRPVLAVEAGVAYWRKIDSEYLGCERRRRLSGHDGGWSQLQYILNALVRIFEQEEAFLKYLQEFDVFIFQTGWRKRS